MIVVLKEDCVIAGVLRVKGEVVKMRGEPPVEYRVLKSDAELAAEQKAYRDKVDKVKDKQKEPKPPKPKDELIADDTPKFK
jgi:hypothetical protein